MFRSHVFKMAVAQIFFPENTGFSFTGLLSESSVGVSSFSKKYISLLLLFFKLLSIPSLRSWSCDLKCGSNLIHLRPELTFGCGQVNARLFMSPLGSFLLLLRLCFAE